MNELRDAAVFDAALTEARVVGYDRITREAIAWRAGVSTGTVSNVGTMADIKSEVVEMAVAGGHLDVVAQALANRHPVALAAPEDLRARALASMLAG